MTHSQFSCVNTDCPSVHKSRRALRLHYAHRPACRDRMRAMHQILLQQHQIQLPDPDEPDIDQDPNDNHDNPDFDLDVEMTDTEDPPSPLTHRHRSVSVEEVEDEGDGGQEVHGDAVWIEEYDGAGATFGDGAPQREREKQRQRRENEAPWAPFESFSEWKFAKWMMKWGLTGDGVDELLDLDLVSAFE